MLPTKASTPAVSVKGTKAGTVKSVLPHTGSGVPVGLLLATSLALLLGGGALMCSRGSPRHAASAAGTDPLAGRRSGAWQRTPRGAPDVRGPSLVAA